MFGSTSLVKTQLASLAVLVFCIVTNRIFEYYEELDEHNGRNLYQQYDYIVGSHFAVLSLVICKLIEKINFG